MQDAWPGQRWCCCCFLQVVVMVTAMDYSVPTEKGRVFAEGGGGLGQLRQLGLLGNGVCV